MTAVTFGTHRGHVWVQVPPQVEGQQLVRDREQLQPLLMPHPSLCSPSGLPALPGFPPPPRPPAEHPRSARLRGAGLGSSPHCLLQHGLCWGLVWGWELSRQPQEQGGKRLLGLGVVQLLFSGLISISPALFSFFRGFLFERLTL